MKKILERYILVILSICFIFVAFTLNAYADEASDRVRVGFYEYPCFQKVFPDGRVGGYSYEYLKAISQFNDWQYEFVTGYTYDECLQLLEKGELDLMGTLKKTPELMEKYDFPDYSSMVDILLLVKNENNNDIEFDNFESFDGMKVGMQKGFNGKEFLTSFAEEKGFSFHIVIYDSNEELSNALENNEVDTIFITGSQMSEDYRVVTSFELDSHYFVTTKGNEKILNELNEGIKNIQQILPNLQKDLYKKYYVFKDKREPIFTDEERDFLNKNKVLNVVYDANWGPYESIDKNGNPFGMSIDIMNKLAKIMGVEFNYIPVYSQEEKIELMNNGKGDIISGIRYDYDTADKYNVYVSQPYITVEYVLAYKTDSKTRNLIALPKGHNITSMLEEFRKDSNQIELVYYDNVRQCMDALYNGQVDYTFLSDYEAEYYLVEPRYNSIFYRSIPMNQLDLSIGISKNQNAILYKIIEKSLYGISIDDVSNIITEHITYKNVDSIIDLLYSNPLEFTVILVIILVTLIIALVSLTLYYNNRKKNIELQQSNKAKSMFLARVSHDMRTPMNGILGIAYLAKEKDDINELKDDIRQIEMSGKMLLNLINDTIDISRIESGKMELHPEVCNEEEIFGAIMSILDPLIKEKNIKFTYNKINIGNEDIFADPQRLQQIVINLVTNSVKFTPKNGEIAVTLEGVERYEDKVLNRLIVKDTGIGMSKKFQANLFSAFSQENKINTDSIVGIGLGLTIVKNIVDLMGGTIKIESEENVGTEITIDVLIPLASKQKSKALPVAIYEKLSDKRVLMCEDHDVNAKIAIRLLEKQGMLVERAENGKIGVEMFKNSKDGYYDLILMDIRMPEMDGYDATKKIRAINTRYARLVPIIALSANAFAEDIEKSRQVGMDDYLSKPIDPQKLYETLSEYL